MLKQSGSIAVTLLLLAVACSPPSLELYAMTPLPPVVPPSDFAMPLIKLVDPSSWPNQGGVPITIHGQAFAPNARVTIDGLVSVTHVLSDTQLTAYLPVRPDAFGPVPIVVENPDGKSSAPSYQFSYSATILDFPFARYTAGLSPQEILIADLNSDGILDLATANEESNDIGVLFGQSQGRFQDARRYAAGRGPASLVTADFNHDRIPDLAVANFVGNSINILFGDGRGGYLTPHEITDPQSIRPLSIAVGDFDKDGAADLAVALRAPDLIWVLLGDGAGGFPRRSLLPAGGVDPTHVIVGDWNGDKNLDLVVTLHGSTAIGVLLGDGRGGFAAAATVSSLSQVVVAAAGDMNHDGKLDLVVASDLSGGGKIRVHLGNGRGGFSNGALYTTKAAFSFLTLADLNRDGNPDVVASHDPLSEEALLFLFNDGAGGFIKGNDLRAYASNGIAAADLDRDGDADLVVANASTDSVSVLLGDGKGTFSPVRVYPTCGTPLATLQADLNRDGRPDLLTLCSTGNLVSVMFGTASGFVPGSDQPVGNGPRAMAIGDLNGDGKPDLVVATELDKTAELLLGDGTGRFVQRTVVPLGAQPWDVALGDLDRDGKLDMVIATQAPLVEILFGDGQGGIKDRRTLVLEWTSAVAAIGDLDSDGIADLVLSQYGYYLFSTFIGDGHGGFVQTYRNSVRSVIGDLRLIDLNDDQALDMALATTDGPVVFLGNGHGAFFERFAENSGVATPRMMDFADINGDRKLDMVVMNHLMPDVSVLLGDGAGGFLPGRHFLIGGKLATLSGGSGSGRALAVADFDGDGRPDVAVPTVTPDQVVVLPNLSR